MKHAIGTVSVLLVLIPASPLPLFGSSGPFDGKTFRGRIAFSSDGNFNDEDDWGAFPVAAALLEAFGVVDRLVHVDHSNILVENDPRFHSEMTRSVLGAAERYGIPRSILFDCQQDLQGAVASIAEAIDASSAENPLYYILAGPMEVPFLGIEKSDPAKRKYVYCISHSAWNDGYTRADKSLHRRNKRDVIPSGINWIQVRDGNQNLAHPGGVGKRSTPEQWGLYGWMKDARDHRLHWIHTRLEAEGRADISDATMTYFLLTGDEEADLGKLKSVLDDKKVPVPIDPRMHVRIEAENFRKLDNYRVESRSDRRASHRLNVHLPGARTGRISTPFDQPYTASSGRYDVDVRHLEQAESQSELTFLVNGRRQGDSWRPAGNREGWITHTIPDVAVNSGDTIVVEVRSDAADPCRLDYVQLNYRSPSGSSRGDEARPAPGM